MHLKIYQHNECVSCLTAVKDGVPKLIVVDSTRYWRHYAASQWYLDYLLPVDMSLGMLLLAIVWYNTRIFSIITFLTITGC